MSTEKSRSDPPPSPAVPFISLKFTKPNCIIIEQGPLVPYYSCQRASFHPTLTTAHSQNSLTKFTVINLAVEQTHGDVPASGSVYCSVAGLLAFQIVPVDISIWCFNHSYSKIPYKKDTPKGSINTSGKALPIWSYFCALWVKKYFWLTKLNVLCDVHSGDTNVTRRSGYLGRILWRRAWHPTPVFLPGEFHGQRSLFGYSP